MSFADAVRTELSQITLKRPCCRKALTYGLLLGATVDGQKQIRARYGNEISATLATQMIHAIYGKEPLEQRSGACGHRYWDLSFSAPSFYKTLRWLEGGTLSLVSLVDLDCEGCRSAFLRGLFLATGTVNDPHKAFHLEILGSENAVPLLEEFLTLCGYPPRKIRRPKGIGLYYKDSATVEELLTLMGAQTVIFEIINSRIEREIRNNENRATNCVAKNIEKTISASSRQMDAINLLMERGKLEKLPENVRTTAMIRYRNPDATLDELARLHEPPISKSGLNHRLQRILQEAEDL
ncbi:MAG: DNA-binding protein WhiA [Clostridia bacterium]|nr:DNA-binding protein WhiA [Clostridia bacterium]